MVSAQRGGGAPSAKGKQVILKQTLQDKRAGWNRQKQLFKAPTVRGQGPGHRHTVNGPSGCVHPPKEGGCRVEEGGDRVALALEKGHSPDRESNQRGPIEETASNPGGSAAGGNGIEGGKQYCREGRRGDKGGKSD